MLATKGLSYLTVFVTKMQPINPRQLFYSTNYKYDTIYTSRKAQDQGYSEVELYFPWNLPPKY